MKIIGTGLVCLDIIHKESNIAVMNGGTCANVLTVLAQLGEYASVLIPDYYIDGQSEYFYTTLRKMDINFITYCKTKKNIPKIIEVYDKNRNHLFYTKCPWCGQDLLESRFITKKEAERLISRIVDHDIFFIDRISDGIKWIAEEYGALHKKVMYEPNSGRNLKAVVEMSRLANIIKFSEDKISLAMAQIIREQCKKSVLDLIIVTRGERGMNFSYRLDEEEFSDWIEGPNIKFIGLRDTSGAGDWLTAGFLHFWSKTGYTLEKQALFDSLRAALELSAICSKKEGAQGAFYDTKLFECLKNSYHIKLEKNLHNDVVSIQDLLVCKNCFERY